MGESFNPVADCRRSMIDELEEWRRKIAEIQQNELLREPHKQFAIDQYTKMIIARQNEMAGFERLIESITYSWPLNQRERCRM